MRIAKKKPFPFHPVEREGPYLAPNTQILPHAQSSARLTPRGWNATYHCCRLTVNTPRPARSHSQGEDSPQRNECNRYTEACQRVELRMSRLFHSDKERITQQEGHGNCRVLTYVLIKGKAKETIQ